VADLDRLDVTVAAGPDGVVVAVAGEIDPVTGPDLERQVELALATDAPVVIMDLEGVEFIDSCGLRILLDAYSVTSADSRRLVLRRPSDVVRRLLAITDLAATFEIVD
jgi:anti-anti-sigma factor